MFDPVTVNTSNIPLCCGLAQLELKYVQERLLAVGGCGSVFTGYRKIDNFPVSITHVSITYAQTMLPADRGL